jgi:hypothetical protein
VVLSLDVLEAMPQQHLAPEDTQLAPGALVEPANEIALPGLAELAAG